MLIIDTLHSIVHHTNIGYNLWKTCAAVNVGPRFQVQSQGNIQSDNTTRREVNYRT